MWHEVQVNVSQVVTINDQDTVEVVEWRCHHFLSLSHETISNHMIVQSNITKVKPLGRSLLLL